MEQLPRREETPVEAEQHREELPPGHFVTDDLQIDCSRFLKEILEVVKRRSEAGLGPR